MDKEKVTETAERFAELFGKLSKDEQRCIQERNIGFMEGIQSGYDRGYADAMKAARAAG